MNEVNEEEDNLSMSDEEQKMEMSFGAKKMAAPQQQKKKEKGVFGKMADKVSQKMYKASKMN